MQTVGIDIGTTTISGVVLEKNGTQKPRILSQSVSGSDHAFYLHSGSVLNRLIHLIEFPAHSLESPVNKRCRCEIVRTEIGNTSGLLRMYSGSVKCCFYLKFLPVFPPGAGCFPVSC